MKKVILYTQDHSKVFPLDVEVTGNFKNYDALSGAVVKIVKQIDADIIIAATKSGTTAEAISAQRPEIPIISVTSNPRVAGQLALAYANSAFVRDYDDNYAIDVAQDLKLNGYLKTPEDKEYLTAIVVSGLRDEEGGTNQIQIRKI